MPNEIMNIRNPRFDEFLYILAGPRGIDLSRGAAAQLCWRCDGTLSISRQILETEFPEINVDESLAYFESLGKYCDCELLFSFPDE